MFGLLLYPWKFYTFYRLKYTELFSNQIFDILKTINIPTVFFFLFGTLFHEFQAYPQSTVDCILDYKIYKFIKVIENVTPLHHAKSN